MENLAIKESVNADFFFRKRDYFKTENLTLTASLILRQATAGGTGAEVGPIGVTTLVFTRSPRHLTFIDICIE